MKNSRLIKKALLRLTTTQLCLYSLLTNEDTKVEDVDLFLKHYDIDKEDAAISFYINDLIDKFDLSFVNKDPIPRIKGLKDYFRFHNASAIMKAVPNELIINPNLILKIKYPRDIRPLVDLGTPLSMQRLEKLAGKRYCFGLVNSATNIWHQAREYSIPNDSYIADLLYLNLCLTLNYSEDKGCIFSNVYDIFRYCKNKKCSNSIRRAIMYSVIRKTVREILYEHKF